MCILSFVPYVVPQILGSWLTDCPSEYGIMTHRLPLRFWVHDSQIAPRIMRLCPTDCPSDYEFMTHRLSLGFMRSCPTDCPSDCEIISHGLSLGYEMHSVFRWFLFSSIFITKYGTWFLLSPCFLEIDFCVLWHLCVLSWCVRCLIPLWVPLRMAWLD